MGMSLKDQPFYGVPNESKWGWSLWAGYCSYSFQAVRNLALNFLNDFSLGLDTGGRNWSCLYRNFDRARLRFGEREKIKVRDPFDGTVHPVEVVDGSWIHLGGAGYSNGFQGRLQFYERMAKATDEGANLQMLTNTSGGAPGGRW